MSGRTGCCVALALTMAAACETSEPWAPIGDLPPRVVDALEAAHEVAESTSTEKCQAIVPDRCSHEGSPPGVPYGPNALDGRAGVADYRIECIVAPEGSSSVGACAFEPRRRGAGYDRSVGMSYGFAPGYRSLGPREPGDMVLVNESELPYRVTVVHRIDREMLVRVTAVVAAH